MKDETEKRMETREETPARVPYIGKSVKKLKCWRPKRNFDTIKNRRKD